MKYCKEEYFSMFGCIRTNINFLTWKRTMMVQIRPRTAEGMPSATSEASMLLHFT